MERDSSYPERTTLLWHHVECAPGPVAFAVRGGRVVEIRLGRRVGATRIADPFARRVARDLKAYLAGERRKLAFPFRLEATPFTTAVLDAVEKIPPGRAQTYGAIARRVGKPRAARAVGQAVGANPLPLRIPCHRVLAAHGRLGGFGAGLKWKRALLRLEGIDWSE